MAARAIDFHVHLPTPDWLDGSMAGYVEAAEAYFRSPVQRASLAGLAARYRSLNVRAVLLAWDAETATGRPRVPNETVAAACQEHGLLALFHTGTSGIGAGQPGGQGIGLDFARPIRLDAIAAAHPGLTVVAAHFGWPWHMELVAMALHKTNVYIDISGWSPKRIPAELVRELRGRLSEQFLWGSDFPFLTPERCLAELDSLDLPGPARERLLHENAARILGLDRD